MSPYHDLTFRIPAFCVQVFLSPLDKLFNFSYPHCLFHDVNHLCICTDAFLSKQSLTCAEGVHYNKWHIKGKKVLERSVYER